MGKLLSSVRLFSCQTRLWLIRKGIDLSFTDDKLARLNCHWIERQEESQEDIYWTRTLAKMTCNRDSTREEFDKTRRACKNLIEHAITSNHVTLTEALMALAEVLKQQELHPDNLDRLDLVDDNAGAMLHQQNPLQPADNRGSTSLGTIPHLPMPISSTSASTEDTAVISAAAVSTQDATPTEQTSRPSKHQRPISSDIEAHDKANRPDQFRQDALDDLRRIL